MISFRTLMLSGLLATFVPFGTACYADEETPAPEYADVGYSPQYYDGYVVYYDEGGRPYYYNGTTVFWVPPTSPYYVGLVGHWRRFGPAYHRWNAHYGYRYHGYRRHYR